MADVIAKWQLLKPMQDGCVVADVIASGRWKNHKVNYFNFSSEVLNRTSSQTCGRWYLPTFLLRDGSLTLMYRASFIVLIWFKSSLPTNVEVVDGNIVTTDVAVVIYGRGEFQMFLEPFTKSSWGLSNIFLITIHPVTMVSVDDSTLLLDWVFVFGSYQEVLDGSASFNLYPKLSANVLNALTKSTVRIPKYPTWALNRIQMKINKQDSKQVPTNRTSTKNQKKSYIVVPYYLMKPGVTCQKLVSLSKNSSVSEKHILIQRA